MYRHIHCDEDQCKNVTEKEEKDACTLRSWSGVSILGKILTVQSLAGQMECCEKLITQEHIVYVSMKELGTVTTAPSEGAAHWSSSPLEPPPPRHRDFTYTCCSVLVWGGLGSSFVFTHIRPLLHASLVSMTTTLSCNARNHPQCDEEATAGS